jgi:calcium channel MID1
MVVLNATQDVYIGVFAPSAAGYNPSFYNYDLAASIDAPYHYYNESDPNLIFIDSDSNSAMLMTNN